MKIVLLSILLLLSNTVFSRIIETINNPHGYKNIVFRGYSFSIPENLFVKETEIFKDTLFIGNKQNKAVISVKKIPVGFKGFYRPITYNMKGSTMRELLSEIYGNHKTTNMAINEVRGMKNPNTEIYERDGFMFFHELSIIDDMGVSLTPVSTPINDEVLAFSFTDKADKKVIMNVLKSLKVKK